MIFLWSDETKFDEILEFRLYQIIYDIDFYISQIISESDQIYYQKQLFQNNR